MIFKELSITNFKSYEQETISLDEGVTTIKGPNGAGKSSLLDAAFFALYGSSSLQENETLEKVITQGKERAVVSLTFTHDETEYYVSREIIDGRTAECTMEEYDGKKISETYDGVRNVEQKIEELLGMDALSLLNSAYIRQGDIKRIIYSSPEERGEIIDELLQLGLLDVYKERADNTRVGVKRVMRSKEAEVETLETQYEENRSVEELEEKITEKKDKLNDKEERQQFLEEFTEWMENSISNIDDSIQSIEDNKENIRKRNKKKKELEEKRGEISELDSAISEKKEEINSVSREFITEVKESDLFDIINIVSAFDENVDIDEVESYITNHKENIESMIERKEELKDKLTQKEQEVARLEQNIDHTEEKINEVRKNIDALETKKEESEENIKQKNNELSQNIEEIKKSRIELNEVPDKHTETEWTIQAEETLKEKKEKLSEKIAEVKHQKETQEVQEKILSGEMSTCPTCGQDITNPSEHVELNAESNLDDELRMLENIQTSCEDVEEILSNYRRKRSEMEKEIENKNEIEEKLEAQREKKENLIKDKKETEEKRERKISDISELEEEISEVSEDIDEYDGAVKLLEDKKTEIEGVIQDKEQTQRDLDDTRRQEELLENKIDQLAEQIGDNAIDKTVSELEEEKAEFTSGVEEFRSQISNIEEEIKSIRTKVGELQQEKEQQVDTRKRLKKTRKEMRVAEEKHGEMESLVEMYGDLKKRLRQENVEYLEVFVNEIFNETYQNDMYNDVRLTNNYEIIVQEKSGEELTPDMLSEGEQTIFTLSLRCAIYKMLAQSSTIAELPPLIFDEPTADLDVGHINEISSLVETMRSVGVDQTFIVSHNEEIVGSTDDTINVSVDPSTNRSTAEREETQTIAF